MVGSGQEEGVEATDKEGGVMAANDYRQTLLALAKALVNELERPRLEVK